MEALNLALGLGMARRAVLLADPEVGEQVLEAVAAAGEARGVDGAVVGERGGRPAVGVAGRGERGHHVVAGHPAEHRAGEQVARVVVEPVEDLDLAPVGQAPMGEVGLPDFVRCRGLEPDPRAARALARLGHDQSGGVEDAPDRRARRHGQARALEVPGDRDRTRVEAIGSELAAQCDDPVAHGVGRSLGAAAWPTRARLDGLQAVVPVAAQEPVQVPAADPGLGCRGGNGQLR